MRLPIVIGSRRVRRWHLLLGAVLLFGAVWMVYSLLFHLADSLIASLRKPAPTRSPGERRHRMATSVVVAHYIGAGNLFGNLTDDIVNQNFYEPRAEEGALGRPVAIPAREVLKMQHLFRINRYNLLASDRIPLNRTLPDQRKQVCRDIDYTPATLPNTTVIIVFHNEAWSVLLRTVWSVINRTPAGLLHEILLVDDASTRTFLHSALRTYCATLPVRTRVLRLATRRGLVAARLLGARHARGATLTFLDAHCECSAGWLPPLLARVRDQRSTIACPVIDIISDDNFGYVRSFELHSGAFNWQLHFRWYLQPERQLRRRHGVNDTVAPFETPAMAGGLFTVDRAYFAEVGGYDEEMRIWGGENLEMSWRVWQCGGRVEIVPCSHVGHLFRKSSPYTFPGGQTEVMNGNLARAALVWMDGWAAFFFRYQGVGGQAVQAMNVSSRLALRQRLGCKPFSWYLDTVWPENFFPGPGRLFAKLLLLDTDSNLYADYVHTFADFDMARNLDLGYTIDYLAERTEPLQRLFATGNRQTAGYCVQSPAERVLGEAGSLRSPYGQALVRRCQPAGGSGGMAEMFVLKRDGHIMTNEGICVDSMEKLRADDYAPSAQRNATMVRIVTCAETERQRWLWDARALQLRPAADATMCATAADVGDDSGALLRAELAGEVKSTDRVFNVTVRRCASTGDVDARLQRWVLLPLPWR